MPAKSNGAPTPHSIVLLVASYESTSGSACCERFALSVRGGGVESAHHPK